MTIINNGFNVLDKYKHLSVEEIKSFADADRLPYAVLSLNLEKDLNIANVIRSAHIFGAERVFTIGWNKVDSRGMVGCQNYTNLEKVRVDADDLSAVNLKISEICSEYDFEPVFVEYNDDSKPITSNKFKKICKKRPLLIMGNEGQGIPTELMKVYENENVFHINQRGVMRSLNVSSAASVVFHQVMTNLTSKSLFNFFKG